MEHGEDDAAGAEEFREARDALFRDRRLEIVQNVPEQHRVEGRRSVLQVGLYKTCRAAGRSQINVFRGIDGVLQPAFLFGYEILPGAQQVVRSDAKAAFYEKVKRSLPRRAKVQKRSAAQPV